VAWWIWEQNLAVPGQSSAEDPGLKSFWCLAACSGSDKSMPDLWHLLGCAGSACPAWDM